MSKAPKEMVGSTAGAVPVRNEKGQITMERVKVSRYITGKRPHYARDANSDYEDSDDEFVERKSTKCESNIKEEVYDRRLKRLQEVESKENIGNVRPRREIEVTNYNEVEDKVKVKVEQMDDDDDDELSDDEIQRRREMLKNAAKMKKEEEAAMDVAAEDSKEEESEEESEYEDETDSEDDLGQNDHPKYKPVFIKKENRTTLIEQENDEKFIEELEEKADRERREESLRIIEVIKQREIQKLQEAKALMEEDCGDTDDEDNKENYMLWEKRELERFNRDKNEREEIKKMEMERDRIKNMTEEERIQEKKLNPKVITNKAEKGKMKFQQKYFHRGAFYLDEESDILKRNFQTATGDDLVDKTTLPACMQVKNFGRAGRSKYTHLADQDTSKIESPWFSNTLSNKNFYEKKGGGMRQILKPKRKNEN